jgi:peptidoglycan hydrolase-like protein with peptidoglycan-binding domain
MGEGMRRPWIVAAVGAAVIAAIVATLLVTRPQAQADDDSGAPPTETSTIARGDLVERVRVTGKLGYRGVRDLVTSLPGTLTGVPAAGTIVGRGGELFRVDDSPVVLMFGQLPVWRAFAEGMTDGADVRQLEENLAALGFFDREPDQEFAWSTAEAIIDWQESLGLEETGVIEQGRIVFAPGEVRIAQVVANVGDPAGGAVLTVSEASKEATVDLDPNLAATAPVGASVEVSLPNGTVTTGTITAVGAPVERDNANGGKSLKLPVTLVLDDPATADGLDDVKVSATFVRVVAEDVLLVPVTALLAQPGGGSAVERVVDGGTELVPIELGGFADGLVEVAGGELAEGDVVAVAQ